MSEGKVVLKTENLTHIYGVDTPFEKVAVDNVSVEINSNDFIGVIGHTGSGKSTLIQHFNGLLKPSFGNVLYKGENIWDKGYNLKKLRFNVGMAFQYPEHQLFEETVEKDIGFGPKNMGLSADEVKERVYSSLKFAGLKEGILQKSPFELSGGQKRRVAIAGIMAMKPTILILDEPTAGLDPKGRDEILYRIKEYHENEKVAVLLVSHSMEDIANNTKKVMVLHKGHLEMFAKTEEVFEQSKRLAEINLDVPQITKIFLAMNKKGYDLNTSVFSTDKAADDIEFLYNNLKANDFKKEPK